MKSEITHKISHSSRSHSSRLKSSISLSSQTLLKIFDSLIDLRIIANEREKGKTDEDAPTKLNRLKTDYLKKSEPFLISDPLNMKEMCSICKREIDLLDYEFFNEGASTNFHIDSMNVHRIREHGEYFNDNLKDFLSKIQSSVSTISQTIDRSSVCPFLIRTFLKVNSLFKDGEFVSTTSHQQPGREIYLHGWNDMNLRDIVDLIKEHEPSARQWGSRIRIYFVQVDIHGRLNLREVGTVNPFRDDKSDRKSLELLNFEVGDFLAISVMERTTRKQLEQSNQESKDGKSSHQKAEKEEKENDN